MQKAIAPILFLSVFMLSFIIVEEPAFTTTKFPSKDELAITADLYKIDETKPVILLCHQAGYSRGEYREIAVKLNELGFNCMAIDQRSGSQINDVVNQTAKGAANAKLSRQFGDAEQDIEAAIDFLFKVWKKPVIVWGSSYSASLVLKLGASKENVQAVLAFSPGEYIKGSNISESIVGLTKPTFVTSSKKEAAEVTKLIAGVEASFITQFIPEEEGKHGSKALWSANAGHEEYWTAVEAFLAKF